MPDFNQTLSDCRKKFDVIKVIEKREKELADAEAKVIREKFIQLTILIIKDMFIRASTQKDCLFRVYVNCSEQKPYIDVNQENFMRGLITIFKKKYTNNDHDLSWLNEDALLSYIDPLIKEACEKINDEIKKEHEHSLSYFQLEVQPEYAPCFTTLSKINYPNLKIYF